MKKARFLCLFLVFLWGGISFSHAQTQRAKIPQFTPTVAWQVSPTEMADVRGLEALKLPCVMKAGFNNGFVMRLSGGGNRIMAMAIDFRQRIFERDKNYKARLDINGAGLRSVNALAFSESVLIFDLKNLPNLYSQLSNASLLGLEVEGNQMAFRLGDMRSALGQLEECYSSTTGSKTTRMASSDFPSTMMKKNIPSPQLPYQAARPDSARPVFSGSDLSRPRISRPVTGEYDPTDYSASRVAASETLRSMREPRVGLGVNVRPPMVSESGATPRRIEKLEMPPAMDPASEPILSRPTGSDFTDTLNKVRDVPRAPAVPMKQSPMMADSAPTKLMTPSKGIWNANAGDDMRAVLERWSARANVDLQWQASSSGKVVSDVSVVGTFEEAVQTLMARNAAALGLEAGMKNPTTSSAVQQVSTGSSWQGSMGASQWVAASGSSLRETLQRWSLKEGVAFLWKAGKEYKVKAPVQSNGSYTEALEQLLNQYADDTMRPAASFNVDPSSGDKLLTVE